MTVTSTMSYVTYQGNGLTTAFPFAFLVLNASHLVVTLTDTTQSPNLVTVLNGSQYNVTGINVATGGTVTLPNPLTVGQTLSIRRVVPLTQNTSIINQGGFYPDVLEASLDYLTMEVQQLAEQASRTVEVPVGSGLDPNSYLTTVQSAATTASAAAGAANASQSAAAANQTAAANSASAASVSQNAAAASATAGAASAGAAAASATQAATAATSAATAASTATTEAVLATSGANSATASATTASSAAANAAASAGTASTASTVATAQAAIASAASSTALAALSSLQASALTAAAAASTAQAVLTSVQASALSASAASSTALAAMSSAQTAALSATGASSTALAALSSAQASALAASNSANAAAASQSAAAASAATASTQASNASASASTAQTWAQQAQSAITGAVKVDTNDTTAGYLSQKLVAGSNVTLTVGNAGGNETVSIAAPAPYDVSAHINDGIITARAMGLTSSALRIYNGQVDAFNDQTAQDTLNSVGQQYDGTDKWYSNIDPNTTLLLRAAAGNTGADWSLNNVALTMTGITTTASSQQDAAAFVFSGSSYIQNTSTTATNFIGDFTIECNLKPTSYITNGSGVAGSVQATSGGNAWLFGVTASGTIFFEIGNTYSGTGGITVISTATAPLNAWTNVVICRKGSTVTLYVNGVASGTGSSSQVLNAGGLYMGSFSSQLGNSAYSFFGSLSGFRLSQVARYSGNFTPPTAPFGNTVDGMTDVNTTLYAKLNGNVTDSSANALTLTANSITYGSTNPPISGSQYAIFNGTSSYISGTTGAASATVLSGDFTIEMYVNPSSLPASGSYMHLFSSETTSGDNTSVDFVLTNSGGTPQISWGSDSTGIITVNYTVPIGTWTHLAAVRQGTTAYLFVNGVLVGTGTSTQLFLDGGLVIGRHGTVSQYYFNGSIANFRISKCARWLTAFTPPAAPYSLGTGFALQCLPIAAVNGTPTTGRIVLRHQDLLGTVVPGTDLLVDVSSNGGTTWNTITTLAKADPWDAATNIITGSVALTGGSTAMLARIRTANNKPQRIRAEAFYWS